MFVCVRERKGEWHTFEHVLVCDNLYGCIKNMFSLAKLELEMRFDGFVKFARPFWWSQRTHSKPWFSILLIVTQ